MVGILAKIITRINSNIGMIVLQRRYYSYQRTFPIHKYGVWLEIGCMRRFFVTAIPRATIRNELALDLRMIETTKTYKYLGFIFSPSGEITSGFKDLKE